MFQGNGWKHKTAGLAQFQVHHMFHQVQGNSGNIYRKFKNFDAMELINADFAQLGDIQRPHRLLWINLPDRYKSPSFKTPQFPVGNDEEVAGTAGRIQKAQTGKLVLVFLQCLDFVLAGGGTVKNIIQFAFQFIQEQGTDNLEDVFLRCVMRTKRSACLLIHDGLEHAAEDGRRNLAPFQSTAVEQKTPCPGIELRNFALLAEDVAIDIREFTQECWKVPLSLSLSYQEH